MGKLAWLFVCIQFAASWAQIIEIIPLPCNDKNVEKIGRLAVTYINEDRAVGYKFSLNRISNVHLHVQGPAGKVYYMDLDVLETKCHVRSPKSWKRCDIRPVMETQISGNCNVTILQTPHGFSYLYSYDCTLVPDEPEKLLKICPDCPLLLPLDSAEAQQAARLTLRKYNAQSTIPGRFTLLNITRGSSKNAPLQSSFVEYTIQQPECPEESLVNGLCKPEVMPAGFCVGAVHGSGKRGPEVVVSCEIFLPKGAEVPGTTVDRAGQQKVPEVLPAQHEKKTDAAPSIAVPRWDPKPKSSDPVGQPTAPEGPDAKRSDPFRQVRVPAVPHLKPSAHMKTTQSSESSESVSNSSSDESSEEVGSTVVRPPQDFRYKNHRIKRQAPLGVNPNHIPVFLSIFPASPSPFRSCPGAPRFSTV
ncbi:hypothetical protein AAFF_G00004050 [Aldrovandia affinis]|uniref:Cystatin fetuin-B-type domain-containing protein n=1 Tax=Aldrovandia affinis TaxID=143900 RepID=A0AAD7TDH4_9TELE|nr:hypothetical protein AAFF_G00004050 [Aldrovandia affinis]